MKDKIKDLISKIILIVFFIAIIWLSLDSTFNPSEESMVSGGNCNMKICW